jgi:hypothetical protein
MKNGKDSFRNPDITATLLHPTVRAVVMGVMEVFDTMGWIE